MVMGLFAMSGMEVTNDEKDHNDNYDNDDKVNAEEADACTLEILEAIDVDKDGDVTMVRCETLIFIIRGSYILVLGGIY